jgi:hypothetical protein
LTVDKPERIRKAAWSINYDARKDMGDWTDDAWYLPGYDDSSWGNAEGRKSRRLLRFSNYSPARYRR